VQGSGETEKPTAKSGPNSKQKAKRKLKRQDTKEVKKPTNHKESTRQRA
jgi:hypothetical protein